MPDPLVYQLLLVGLMLLCLMLHIVWPYGRVTSGSTTPLAAKAPRQRSRVPHPFPGLLHKPPWAACEQAPQAPDALPPTAPLPLISRRGRPRAVDTSQQFCPPPTCAYRGWVGLGHLSANSHPSGGPWRQCSCTACEGYLQETHGTPFHGQRGAPEKLGWAVDALAEGLGIRAGARGFEGDPNTVLAGLVEVAEHAAAFSQYFLHDVRVTQVQLDALCALRSAMKTGAVSEAAAIPRLSRSPSWAWAAIDPVTKLLLPIEVGDRTLAMAQGVVLQVVHVLAPGCVPRFVTDGFKEYMTVLLTHDGQWMHPPRQRAQGPAPSRAGCRCPRCCMRRWSRRCVGDGWSVGGIAWASAPWWPSSRGWPHRAGRSTPRSLSG